MMASDWSCGVRDAWAVVDVLENDGQVHCNNKEERELIIALAGEKGLYIAYDRDEIDRIEDSCGWLYVAYYPGEGIHISKYPHDEKDEPTEFHDLLGFSCSEDPEDVELCPLEEIFV